ncbi:MAG: alcohol dehydrogenase catalytic domain-containing protein [Anaerolineae bacterium]|nr:alcohol dehydrogenase catalytic domain-containing protein [Anaerolineae bacterium]
MKAAFWMGPEKIEIREVERPTPGPGEALVKVAYGGICGTDLMIYLGKHPRAKAPLVLCHEFSGTIVQADGDALAPGTPVVINPLLTCGQCYACRSGIPHVCANLGLVGIDRDGGFAEYVSVPLQTVRPIPETLPLIEAALIEPLAVAVHAVRASDLSVGDQTAVLGAGPIGNLTAQVARLAGARQVFVSEQSPKRVALAQRLGFEVIDVREKNTVEAIRQATEGVGVPVVFETAGVQATIDDAGQVARIGGQILQVGMPKTPPTVDMTTLLFREIRRTPIRVYRESDFFRAIALAATGRLDLRTPVTHILPLEELEKGLELAHEATESCKILIAPNL